jgi:hypothetical protein
MEDREMLCAQLNARLVAQRAQRHAIYALHLHEANTLLDQHNNTAFQGFASSSSSSEGMGYQLLEQISCRRCAQPSGVTRIQQHNAQDRPLCAQCKAIAEGEHATAKRRQLHAAKKLNRKLTKEETKTLKEEFNPW